MKKIHWLVLGIVACLAFAAGMYFWATGLITSLYDFRSPLHASPPQPGQPVGAPLTRRLVVVLIDGLRDDTSHDTAVMPYLNQLRSQGAWTTTHSRVPSYSEPGYSVLMTGAWPDISDGPAMNLDYPDIPTWTQDNLFSAAHRQGLRTAISGYYWFERLVPQAAVTDSYYTPGEDAAADEDVISAALHMLDTNDQLVLIHIDQVDYAGHHLGGPRDPRWNEAAARVDGLVKQIAARLDFSKDSLVVFSDHGQIDRGGHGGQDPIVLVEPFVLVGAGVRPGHYADIHMVDIAPTLATLLGLNIPASSEGYILTDMLAIPDAEQPAMQSALKAQQAQLFQAYTKAIGSTAALPDLPNVVTATQAAMVRARDARLARERLPRAILAFVLALIPAAFLVLRRKKDVLLLLAGAALYALIFNLIYAVIDGRTYSLSSVASQTEIIVFVGVTATASLIIAWLVISLLDLRRISKPLDAAAHTLAFVLITLYLLALPILISFAVNGTLITWTIPEFLTMFLGFLSILQALVVAIIGLILTGLAAAISAVSRKMAPQMVSSHI